MTSARTGTDSLLVQFSCDCQEQGSAIAGYFWDFGDGLSTEAAPTHAFGPGRHRVRLWVVAENGLEAIDSTTIEVATTDAKPPDCSLSAKRSGASIVFRATFGDVDGQVVQQTISLNGGAPVAGPIATISPAGPGMHTAELIVEDSQGLRCQDRVEVVIPTDDGKVPTKIRSIPTLFAACGEPWSYSASGLPVAAGERPVTWSLLAADGSTLPPGMAFDAATGRMTWTRHRKDVAVYRVIFRVEGPSGSDEQTVEIVRTCEMRLLDVGCACTSVSLDSLLWFGALAVLWRLRGSHPRSLSRVRRAQS